MFLFTSLFTFLTLFNVFYLANFLFKTFYTTLTNVLFMFEVFLAF